MTKEEFFIEMGNKTKELKEIEERLDKIWFEERFGKIGFTNNEECDRLRERRDEICDTLKWYQKLIDKTASYSDYIWAYERFLEYSKEHNLEEIPSISDKISFLKQHYRKEELFSVDFNYDPYNLGAIENGFGDKVIPYLEEDINNVLHYFKKKKEKDVYKWELEYATFLLFYDQICHTSHSVTPLGNYKELERTKECEEYVNNCDKLIKELNNNNTFSFNLLLWTVYKIYHYLRNQNSEFVVNKSDLILIDRLFTLSLKTTREVWDKRIIKENQDLTEDEKYFIFNLSQLLCLDLIHTIYGCFPDYYDTCIMFLGDGLYIPGGCSYLTANMKSFGRYIDDITDYDYWIEIDERELNGPEIFEKMNIKDDYKEVLKNNDLI